MERTVWRENTHSPLRSPVGQPHQLDGAFRQRQPDVGVAVVGVRNVLVDHGSVAQDDLAELVGQLLADLLAGGGGDLGQVQAAEGALGVAAEVGGQEGAEGGARRGDVGGDVQRGGLLVAVLQDLPRRRRHRGNLGHGVAVEQPAAVRLAPQGDAAAVGAGKGVHVAGRRLPGCARCSRPRRGGSPPAGRRAGRGRAGRPAARPGRDRRSLPRCI